MKQLLLHLLRQAVDPPPGIFSLIWLPVNSSSQPGSVKSNTWLSPRHVKPTRSFQYRFKMLLTLRHTMRNALSVFFRIHELTGTCDWLASLWFAGGRVYAIPLSLSRREYGQFCSLGYLTANGCSTIRIFDDRANDICCASSFVCLFVLNSIMHHKLWWFVWYFTWHPWSQLNWWTINDY